MATGMETGMGRQKKMAPSDPEFQIESRRATDAHLEFRVFLNDLDASQSELASAPAKLLRT
jgi:hypothetical protein